MSSLRELTLRINATLLTVPHLNHDQKMVCYQALRGYLE